MNHEKVYQMEFSRIYPLLVNKVTKKGRTKAEVDEVIQWLTGYSQSQIDQMADGSITYASFFEKAPQMNPKRKLITGSVCGVRLDSIEEPLMLEIRYLDKLIDELAKGKEMEKILRK